MNQDPQDLLDHQDLQDLQVNLVAPDLLVPLDHLDVLDQLGLLVQAERGGHRESVVQKDLRAHLALLDHLDLVEIWDLQDQPAPADHQVHSNSIHDH